MPDVTVLLVEDNEDDVFAMERAFRKAALSANLTVLTDGRQAMDYLSGTGKYSDRADNPLPSLIFLDLKLPYYNGHELMEWMRDRPILSDIPIVILTGSDETSDHQRCVSNGAKDYLVKPSSPEIVRDVVKRFVPLIGAQ